MHISLGDPLYVITGIDVSFMIQQFSLAYDIFSLNIVLLKQLVSHSSGLRRDTMNSLSPLHR